MRYFKNIWVDHKTQKQIHISNINILYEYYNKKAGNYLEALHSGIISMIILQIKDYMPNRNTNGFSLLRNFGVASPV